MDRTLAMLAIGLVFGGGIGFVTAAGYGVTLDGHDHDTPEHHATDAEHDGATPHEIAAGPEAPALTIALTRDPVSGWNLRMNPRNFRFAPERLGTGYEPGEGHAHVYVNGEKVMRAYGGWVHLDALPDGDVTVKAALYGNDHRPLVVAGSPVADDIRITVD